MNQATTADPLRQDILGAAKRRYTAAIIVLTLICVWLMQNPFFPSASRLILLALVLLGMIRSTAAILLILFQIELYLTESSIGLGFGPPAMIFAVVTVALLMILSRLRSAQDLTGERSVAQLIRSTAGGLLRTDRGSRGRDEGSETGEPLRIAVFTAGLVIAAELLLQMFPVDISSVRDYGLTPGGMRAAQLGLTLFTIYILVALPLGELRWKQLTPDQAGIHLRSRFVSWLYRDLAAVERKNRRRRYRLSSQRHRTKQQSPDQPHRKPT